MNTCMNCTCADKWREHAHLLLRVVTGFIFFYHGYDKVFGMGMEAVTGFFTQVGIPLASVCAYLVSYGELLGGIALILGLFTHWVSKANILIMLGAIWFVHLENGFSAQAGGYEYALLLLVVSIYFLTAGAGKWSLDAKCKKTDGGGM